MWSPTVLGRSSAERGQSENALQQGPEDRRRAIERGPVLRLAVVSVCVPALESLAEVIVVLALVDVVAGVSIVGIAIRGRILVVPRPAILSIGLPEAHALLIAVVHGLPQDVGAVLVCLAIDAAVVVPIRGRSENVRIV